MLSWLVLILSAMRYLPISSVFFSSNRQRLLGQLPANSVAVIHSNDIYPTNADGTLPYKQNSNLFYLTGVDQEETVLVLWPGAPTPEQREILFLRETNETIAIWEGAKLNKAQAKDLTGISDVRWLDGFEAALHNIVRQSDVIYLELNEHLRAANDVDSRSARFARKLREQYPLHRYARLSPILAVMREVKQQEEIGAMSEACRITEKGFRRVLEFVRPGVGEWEVEAEFSHEFLRNRSRGFAYHPIIASGENACVLHYVENDRVCEDGDLLLLDVGAEYGNYNADMTRTIPVSGKFSARQRQVYDAVLRVLRGADKLLQPGKKKSEYEAQVGELIDVELVELGLLTREQLAGQEPGSTPLRRKWFMHGTSHFLGLDVHDVGQANPVICEGMVYTIEPGLYLREEGIGIRLENNFMVREGGNIDLMANIPIEADEIEALMAVGAKSRSQG